MKISTKGRYGLRAMLDLAIYSTDEHVSLCNIANRQNISENYLEQVFSILRKANLVKSIKGAQGGYTLSNKPEKITIGNILRVLEGNLSVVDENIDDSSMHKDFQDILKIFVWDKMNLAINEIVDNLTLEDLVKEHNKITNNSAIMYYI